MKDNPISTIDSEYIEWLKAIKQQIRSTKIRMIKTANTELIHFYWRLGQMISLKLKEQNWGDKVINKLSVDLHNEFPDMQGFPVRTYTTVRISMSFMQDRCIFHPIIQLSPKLRDNYN